MNKLREVKGMKGAVNIGFVLSVMMFGSAGFTQGSKPAGKEQGGGMQLSLETSATLLQAGPIAATTLEDSHKGKKWIKVHKRLGDESFPWAIRSEFMNEMGQVTGELIQGQKVEGREIVLLLPSRQADVLATIEYRGPSEMRRSPDNPGWVVRFFDKTGNERWRTFLCCDSGGSLENRVILSEDGSIIALLDAGEGQLCYAGERGYPAPPGCVGLRIFTAEGREILREPKGGGVMISPKGKYVLYWINDVGYFMVDTIRKKSHKLPALPVDSDSAWAVDDNGDVNFYRHDGSVPPGSRKYKYRLGKGLEKVRD